MFRMKSEQTFRDHICWETKKWETVHKPETIVIVESDVFKEKEELEGE